MRIFREPPTLWQDHELPLRADRGRRKQRMAEAEVVSALVALGFSLNESRAYRALLLESPATGYEVGVRAQIPRSAVYGVLRRLVSVGAARSIAGTPERFAPAPPRRGPHAAAQAVRGSTAPSRRPIRQLDATPAGARRLQRARLRAGPRGGRAAHRRGRRIASSSAAGRARSSGSSPELKRAIKAACTLVVFSHAALPAKLPGELFSYELDERPSRSSGSTA